MNFSINGKFGSSVLLRGHEFKIIFRLQQIFASLQICSREERVKDGISAAAEKKTRHHFRWPIG